VRLRYDMIAWLGARVADGLHYAHELVGEDGRAADIVHRDVNATNIFLTYDGEVKIIDFGLAKAANRASKTAAGVIKGKVAYMSPEQAVGAPVDRRTDVFALGTTLWELSCDRRLFKHTDEVETLRRVHAADVPDPTKIVDGYPPELARIVLRALARDKERRYATAAALAADLDAFAGGAVNAGVVAEVMRELFTRDRARQAAWVAEASAPEQPKALEPLKAPSTFWVDDPDVPSSTSAPILQVRSAGQPARARSRSRALLVALAIAVALVAFVLIALVLR
jgi:serine/threonine-protein kinase